MEPQSPPKRITRARAAKAVEPATKTTKIVTAAAKAKATRSTSSTMSTANKRKTRPDDGDDSDHDDLDNVEPPPTSIMKPTRATRGRPKKTVEQPPPQQDSEQPPPPVKAARGRPKKVIEPPADEPAKPVRATRTRKITTEEAEMPAEPIKKTTRGRLPLTVAPKTAAKPALKKSVKFEEPEKENIAPAAGRKVTAKAPEPAPATTGLRGKPIRRPGTAGRATAARSTRSAPTVSDIKEDKPIPLSPKKINQLSMSRADSDDELAMDEKAPVRRLKKGPIKPPALGITKSAIDRPAAVTATGAEAADGNLVLAPPEPFISLGSPARRLPPSPFKNIIKSPPRRVEGVLGAPASQARTDDQTAQSPMKMSLLQSPAKRPPVVMGSAGGAQPTPLKMSFLSSPAKRIASPAKAAIPNLAPKATLLTTPLPTQYQYNAHDDDDMMDENGDDAIPDSPTRLRFPGRLSAVLPRHADPALASNMMSLPEDAEDEEDEDVQVTEVENVENAALSDAMAVADVHSEEEDQPVHSADISPPCSPPAAAITGRAMFGLREKDLDGYDHDATESETDEEEPASDFHVLPATPCPAVSSSKKANIRTPSVGRSTVKRVRMDDKFGFTPLADQLSGWTAGPSPLKTGAGQETLVPTSRAVPAVSEPSPMRNTFFEDAMSAAGPAEADLANEEEEKEMAADLDSPVLEDIPFSEEDVALVAEANEMSLMEPEEVEEMIYHEHQNSMDDSISEASQEYGDENENPIDPNLGPITPQRAAMAHREFHTVSKIPLKPADESSSQKIKKRSHSISRLPVQRPPMPRSASVISYSPMKQSSKSSSEEEDQENGEEERATSAPPPVTPSKSEAGSWSTMGTPARTPRRDLNPALLRGAVVFVDVHTTEGADASGIFVELLSQMGARCVKSWSWNPSSPPGKDGSAASKIGITHVVYKDGGKRTLEKVRESAGVVQCVGVSWVLDCERENQWLDEAPYYIDTSMMPRGGARRRKSMEPRAIANMNGMLVPTPVRNTNNGSHKQSSPRTPANGRRASALWVRTPENDEDADHEDDEEDAEEDRHNPEWTSMLTPVPKTPAPEAIARFAANLDLATPSAASEDDDDDCEDPLVRRNVLMTRTCPPKKPIMLGEGILGKEKDERVLMRLMAARRKSLQFAPKIGSPLARAWN
ncbi:hypothetical protein B0H63DRAFT_25413 [Podospora didyma]|uniref:BRCT domain-containing protein n=1 Tax=Podospora didyma TaxID=330526 RepID=A0AAE0U7W3_9PEZI|nr:hypothetical protein B0H63DRAFT_25413 [Podospora didyma]